MRKGKTPRNDGIPIEVSKTALDLESVEFRFNLNFLLRQTTPEKEARIKNFFRIALEEQEDKSVKNTNFLP